MPYLNKLPELWGPWNHASLTSVAKKNAEIKVGIREGFSIKGMFSLKKQFDLRECVRQKSYKTPNTIGILLGNLVGWMWLRNEIYPKYLKFLHPYRISHPRAIGSSFSNFLWEEMERLGQWTLNQGDVVVHHKSTSIQVRWKVHDNEVYGLATRLKGKGKLQLETFGVKCQTYPYPSEMLTEKYFKVKIFEDNIRFSTKINTSPEEIDEILARIEIIPTSSGAIKESLESIITIIGLNSIKTPDRGWLTSLMRRFGTLAGGWSIYLWDNSFIGMMASLYYPQLSKGNLEALCSELTMKGFLPNQANPLGRAETISQLPITSFCALKASKILNETMSGLIPSLESNNNYWLKNRNPNGYHLLSYGSELKRKCAGALRQTAIYESGMDNHPMFNKVPVDYQSGCMALYPVDLNSIYALDCLSLSELAKMAGNEPLSNRMRIRFENMKKVINSFLWDGKGLYRNRYWNGEFQENIYPNYLYPLIAGIASLEQAKSTVNTVLKKCLTPFGIANSSVDHPSFKEQISWRGRLLPPIQFLVSESLRRYEFDLEASDLARRCYRCFYQEWSAESHFHESYNGYNGEGDDVSITGETGHPWAALLPYLSVQDLIDFEPWNGLRLGKLEPVTASINNIFFQNHLYSISLTGEEQLIQQDGAPIIYSTYPTILRNVIITKELVSFRQKALKKIDLKIHLIPGTYQIELDAEAFKEQIQRNGVLELLLKKPRNTIIIKKI